MFLVGGWIFLFDPENGFTSAVGLVIVLGALTYYGLRLMAMLGLVRDLKPVPAWVLAKAEH